MVMNGKRSGGNIMMHQEKQRSGHTSGAALIQTHSLMLAMLMFGMKGTKAHFYSNSVYFIGYNNKPALASFVHYLFLTLDRLHESALYIR